MTISDIITNIETEISNLEDMLQIPNTEKNLIISKMEEVNELLESAADTYGDEADSLSDNEED